MRVMEIMNKLPVTKYLVKTSSYLLSTADCHNLPSSPVGPIPYTRNTRTPRVSPYGHSRFPDVSGCLNRAGLACPVFVSAAPSLRTPARPPAVSQTADECRDLLGGCENKATTE